MENEKELDLFLVVKFFLRYKWVLVLAMIAGFAASWGMMSYTSSAPYYSTFFQLRMPQYCNNKDYITAATIAKSARLQNIVKEQMNSEEDAIDVSADWIANTSVIQVNVGGKTNPETIKAFADAYMELLKAELDEVVNEQFMRDMQMTNLQSSDPKPFSALMQQMQMEKVTILEMPGLPEAPAPSGRARKLALGALMGFCGGMVLVGAAFLYKQFTIA